MRWWATGHEFGLGDLFERAVPPSHSGRGFSRLSFGKVISVENRFTIWRMHAAINHHTSC